MADIFDRVDFRFLPDSTDAERKEVMDALKSQYFSVVSAAGVGNAFLSVQPNSYCAILLKPGDDRSVAAEAPRASYQAIDPGSVRVHLKGGDEE